MEQTAKRPLVIIFSAGFLLFLWVGIAIASYSMLTDQRGQRFDFFPHWIGARTILNGENPYSREVTLRIQEGMFGQQLPPGNDEQRFVYSPLITWLLLPFWLLPFPISVSLWCGLQLLLVILLPVLFVYLVNWQIQPLSLICILIFSTLIFRYPIISYVLGQYTAFSLACLVFTWYGLNHKNPTLIAFSLILTTVRIEIIFLPVIFLLFIAWQENLRISILLWISVMLSLWFFTDIWIGPWELNYFEWLMEYGSYATTVWPPGLLNNTYLAWFLVLAITFWGLWLYKGINSLKNSEKIGWGLSISILVWLIIFPQTGNYTLVLALLPAWLTLYATRGKKILWIAVFAVLGLPWLIYTLNPGNTDSEHLLVPLFIAILLTISWLNNKSSLPTDTGDESDIEFSLTDV